MFPCFIFQSTSQPSDMAKKVDQHLKLDEILDICADFEKQIKAEQEELKQIAQQKIEEEKNQINHQQFQPKSLYRSRAQRHFYGTENEIWAGFMPVGNSEKKN